MRLCYIFCIVQIDNACEHVCVYIFYESNYGYAGLVSYWRERECGKICTESPGALLKLRVKVISTFQVNLGRPYPEPINETGNEAHKIMFPYRQKRRGQCSTPGGLMHSGPAPRATLKLPQILTSLELENLTTGQGSALTLWSGQPHGFEQGFLGSPAL